MHSEVNCNCDYNTDAYIFIPNITAVENTELQGSPQPHNEREASLQTRNPALNKQSKLLLQTKRNKISISSPQSCSHGCRL